MSHRGAGINGEHVLHLTLLRAGESRNAHQHPRPSHYACPDRTPKHTSHRHSPPPPSPRPSRQFIRISSATVLCALLAACSSTTMAQNRCISLADSTACRAFAPASIATNGDLVRLFPFLSHVSDVASFDSGIATYIARDFVQLRYQQLIGCDRVQLDNTTDYYARYTTSVICNAIIQNSMQPCGLSNEAARPLCADACAEYAQSEEQIAASSICNRAGDKSHTQIRADFTNCALPANSISGSCIQGVENQPNDCGFAENLSGLCSYCSASSPNATDSCCVFSKTDVRCDGVQLPVMASASLAPLTLTVSATGISAATSSSKSQDSSASGRGLNGGQIAGVVVGSILGALALIGLITAGCFLLKRRRYSSSTRSVFNQPAPARRFQEMDYNDGARDGRERAEMAVFPGGRVARMSALEGSGSINKHYTADRYSKDLSEVEEASPNLGLAPPPRRSASYSSGSPLGVIGAALHDTSPSSGGEFTSPESHGQSEQLNFFKDYYSQDEIRAGDLVSTLWAYEPRADDEFQLERGDMIKVMGIWDDGWATGVRIKQRAEDWRDDEKLQRDSGLSAPAGRKDQHAAEGGAVKAFPLVCVCLPAHWRKTIEGESTDGSGGPDVFPERG